MKTNKRLLALYFETKMSLIRAHGTTHTAATAETCDTLLAPCLFNFLKISCILPGIPGLWHYLLSYCPLLTIQIQITWIYPFM